MHTSRENVEMTLILIKNIVSKSSHYHDKSRHILVQMPQIENGCQIRIQHVEKHAKMTFSKKNFANFD